VDKELQDQITPAKRTGTEISRRKVLTTAAKAGGAALAGGLGTEVLRPTRARAQSTKATITLRFMHWNSALTTQSAWLRDVLAGFTKLHPGVVVEPNFVAFPQYLPTLTSMSAAKTLPDLYYAHVLAAQLGRAGLSINYRDYVPESFIKQFYPSPIRQFTFDSTKIYALPVNAQTFGIFYSDKLMSQLHLEPPQTWDELIAMAPTIRKAGLIPLSWGNQQSNAGPDFVLPLVTQYGGDVYALDDLTQKGLSWNIKPVMNAFALMQHLNQARVFPDGVNGISWSPQSEQLFYRGQAAMMWSGSWFPQAVTAAAPKSFAYSVTKLPTLTRTGRHWTGDGSGEGVAISAHSPNRDLALAFVKYWFSPAVYNLYIKSTQQFPSIPSAQNMVTDPKVRTMIGYLPDGTDHILFGAGSWNAVSNAVTAVLAGSLTPTAAAAQVEAAVLKTRQGRH
jgi:raffinose/stachyose/melibiose transport system substrate-binding protein